MQQSHPDHANTMLLGGVTNTIGLTINSTNPLLPSNGGTGISNSSTITLGGNINTASSLSTSGVNALTLTTTGPTNVTLPVSGILVNTAVTTLSSLTSIGTITTGTWSGTLISPQFGGTGINNSANTITVSGNFSTVGAFPITLNATASTNITLPTSGTLATVGANGYAVTNVGGTSITMTDSAAVNVYICNNSSLLTLTLPTTIALGHVFKIIGGGGANWKIAQNTSQSIVFEVNGANQSTTNGTGGSLSSVLANDCVELTCTASNTLLNMSGGSAGSLAYV